MTGPIDEYGMDMRFCRRVEPALERIARSYFRARLILEGPADWGGPVIFVANRAGFLPMDAVMAKVLLDPHLQGPGVRPLLEDYVFTLPWVGLWASRLGCVCASQDNAMRLLSRGEPVLAFPEGTKGAFRTVFERDRLFRFGRGGLVRLAVRTGTPVVPVGISGFEAAFPLFGRMEKPGRLVGLPYLPIGPALFGPPGLLPLPVRVVMVVGETLCLREVAGSDDPDDACVLRVNEHVRSRVAELLRRARGGA